MNFFIEFKQYDARFASMSRDQIRDWFMIQTSNISSKLTDIKKLCGDEVYLQLLSLDELGRVEHTIELGKEFVLEEKVITINNFN